MGLHFATVANPGRPLVKIKLQTPEAVVRWLALAIQRATRQAAADNARVRWRRILPLWEKSQRTNERVVPLRFAKLFAASAPGA